MSSARSIVVGVMIGDEYRIGMFVCSGGKIASQVLIVVDFSSGDVLRMMACREYL